MAVECPICKSSAQELLHTGDTAAFHCPTHRDFKVADTVFAEANAKAKDYTRDQWEIRRRHIASSRTTASRRRCRRSSCSRSTRRTTSNGSTSRIKSGRFSISSLIRVSNLAVSHPNLETEVAWWHAGHSQQQWLSTAAACGGSAACAASDCVASSHAPDGKVPPASSARCREHHCDPSC